ncbi:MAG: hypothetical protein K6D97_00675 [Clostridia bacterium]|nr:hypothetical protein [Clostridia bacterium]
MYKNFKEFNFREIVGKFVLIKNTKIVKQPKDHLFVDECMNDYKTQRIEEIKAYRKQKDEYYEADYLEDKILSDSLDEAITTRTVEDLHEPLY